MHPITTGGPAAKVLPRPGEKLLVDKTTGRRYPAAPTGSLLVSSAPFGWRGIIVEQHRLPPAELPEHSVIGHGISVNVGAQPTSFAWTRGRDGWDDRPTTPGHCRILTHGESHASRWCQTYNEVSLIIDPRFVADVVEDRLPNNRIALVTMTRSPILSLPITPQRSVRNSPRTHRTDCCTLRHSPSASCCTYLQTTGSRNRKYRRPAAS